jgi:flagellar biosynthesis protein FlhG
MTDLKLVPPQGKKPRRETGEASRERSRVHFAGLARPHLRTLAVTSGKGGVGKSTVAANLSVALAELGARVILFDGDLAQANLDLLLGVSSRWDLGHVLRGEKTLEQIVVEGPAGIRLVPAASGDPDLADLDDFRREGLYRELSRLAQDADLLIVDTASGASRLTSQFARAATELVVVTTPEPTSYSDAYGLIKVLHAQGLAATPAVLVNRAPSVEEAEEVAHNLASLTRRFLAMNIGSLGALPDDPSVVQAVRRQEPVLTAFPKCPASLAFRALAARLWARPLDPQTRALPDARTRLTA